MEYSTDELEKIKKKYELTQQELIARSFYFHIHTTRVGRNVPKM